MCALPQPVESALNPVQAGGAMEALALTFHVSYIKAGVSGLCCMVLPFPVLPDELVSCARAVVQVPTAKHVFQGLQASS